MEYEIIIKAREPYNVKETKYEADDGKRYVSTYHIPESVKYTAKEYETGEVAYKEKVVYSQKVTELEMYEVIKAVNLSSA